RLAHGSIPSLLPGQSDAKNPIAEDRAERARLDYLALGDWHGTREITPRTWYSGTPEPDRFRDNDPGNALIVTLDGRGMAPVVEKIAVGHYRWIVMEQEISSAEDAGAFDRLLGAQSNPERIVAEVRLAGAVDLAARRRVEEILDRHRARYHVLRTDMDSLVATPTDDDLDRIDSRGFIRAAINELRARAQDPSDSERDTACAALQRLYTEHLRLGG
ncbi:MAG TPA: hypothetical protein VII49_02560, partial [Rhizomicrobium sp.]